jgi:hypothetical protein
MSSNLSEVPETDTRARVEAELDLISSEVKLILSGEKLEFPEGRKELAMAIARLDAAREEYGRFSRPVSRLPA